jgi:hypothetical protein
MHLLGAVEVPVPASFMFGAQLLVGPQTGQARNPSI